MNAEKPEGVDPITHLPFLEGIPPVSRNATFSLAREGIGLFSRGPVGLPDIAAFWHAPKSRRHASIIPILEGIEVAETDPVTNRPTLYRAWRGYRNASRAAVTIPIGPRNSTMPHRDSQHGVSQQFLTVLPPPVGSTPWPDSPVWNFPELFTM
jgi:hypothetical protein